MTINPDLVNGKNFVITGVLPVLRETAEAQLEQLGGKCQKAVTRSTDILIVGVLKTRSTKLTKALALRNAGVDITILDGENIFPRLSY